MFFTADGARAMCEHGHHGESCNPKKISIVNWLGGYEIDMIDIRLFSTTMTTVSSSAGNWIRPGSCVPSAGPS